MGRKDIVRKSYFNNEERFADLFNTICGKGKKLIQPEDLQEMNSEASIFEGQKKMMQGSRDLIKKVTQDMVCFLIGIENQEEVHYGMPVRVMQWDVGEYRMQMERLKLQHRQAKDLKESGEFLSGMKKGEKLKPVCTIVLYYGEEPWDGPGDLYEMLELNGIPEAVKGMIANYPMTLVEVHRFQDWEKFETDLREIFGFVQNSGDEEKLQKFLKENRERLSDMPEDACEFLEEITNITQLKEFRQEKGKGTENMCKAIDDMIKHSEERGHEMGLNQGICGMVRSLKKWNVSREKIVTNIMEEVGVDKKAAEEYVGKYY